MTHATETFLRYLRTKGLKLTPQRAAIVQTFLEAEGHFTAEDLYGKVRRIQPSVGYATVYRTLKLLVDSGLADAFDAGEGVVLYEHDHGHDHHDHLICEQCGIKVEIVDPVIEERQQALAQAEDFVLTRHRMLLFGVCPACKNGKDGKDRA